MISIGSIKTGSIGREVNGSSFLRQLDGLNFEHDPENTGSRFEKDK